MNFIKSVLGTLTGGLIGGGGGGGSFMGAAMRAAIAAAVGPPQLPKAPVTPDAMLVALCSDQSHFVNGAVIAADDGFGV